jgi:hypothetical protein
MKKLQKPNRKVKELLVSKRLNPSNWLVERNVNNRVVLYHRKTHTRRDFAL